MMYEQTLK
jgi:uncharacterized membrane protein YfcA